MEDRLYRGFIAGAIGGIVAGVVSAFWGAMGFTTLRLSDWAAILVFGHKPPFGLSEQLLAFLVHVGFSAAIGSVFAYFILVVTDRKILFKGWLMGLTAWFMVYMAATFFKVEGTMPLPVNTVVGNIIMSSLYGLVLGYSFKALDPVANRAGGFSGILAAPAAKRGNGNKDSRSDEDE